MELKTTKLRKRLPYYCLAKDTAGKAIHLEHRLTEAEGEICTAHAQLAAETKNNFFKRPITTPVAGHETLDALIARRKGLPPIWPVEDRDSPVYNEDKEDR
jgi:hypothetical protein